MIEGSAEDGPTPLLVHGGKFAFPEMLAGWLRMQGARPAAPRRLVIPHIEPGAYSLCQGGRDLQAAGGPGATGGELRLRSPGAPRRAGPAGSARTA